MPYDRLPYDARLGYDPNSVAGYEELPPIFVTPDPEPALPAGWQSPPAGMFDPNLPFQLEGAAGYTPQPAAPEQRDWAFGGAAYRAPNAGLAGGGANQRFGAPMVAPWTPAPAPVVQAPIAAAPAAQPPAYAPLPAEWNRAFDEALYRPQAATPPSPPWWPEDTLWSSLAGVATGSSYAATTPELAARLIPRGIDWAVGKALPADWADAYSNTFGAKAEARTDAARRKVAQLAELPFIPSPLEAAQWVDENTYKPQTVPGEYARTIAEFGPAALVGQPGVGTARRVVTQTVAPALVTETAGQLTKGTPYEAIARVLAGIASALIVPGMTSRVVTPFPVPQERREMGDLLLKERIDVSGGQYTGNPTLRNIESTFNPAADQAFLRRQRDQFSASMLERAGVSGNRGAREAFETAYNNVNKNYAAVSARNAMVPDVKFGEDVTKAVKEYYQLVGATSRAPILDEVGRRIVLDGQRGLTGAGFDNLRVLLSATPADAQLATVLGKIRTALDDAMERSIAANNPADAPAWRQARTQERNLRVIEKAIVRGGEAADAGTVSHSKLYNAMHLESGPRFERYAGDPYDVANAAEVILKAPSHADGAKRTAVTSFMSMLAGAGIGAVAGGPWAATAGSMAGGVAPSLLGQALLSPGGRAYLRNQLWANRDILTPAQRAFMLTLFAGQ